MGEVPAAVAVPARTPPPDVLGVKVTPLGRVPLSVTVGVGVPVVVTVNEPAVPTVNVALFALVNVGIWFCGGGGEYEDPPHATCKANPIMQNAMRIARPAVEVFRSDRSPRKARQITAKENPTASAISRLSAARE